MKLLKLTGLLLLGSAISAFGITITPQFDSFGTLSGATFGGSGIPNDNVAITTILTSTGKTVTLGLTATQRYDNPAPTNDGAGNFFAPAGPDSNSTNPISSYAKWNVGFFIGIDPDAGLEDVFAGYSIRLYYDRDPLSGNDADDFLFLGEGQDSWNLGMNLFNLDGGSFDPSAIGEYGFALVLNKKSGNFITGYTTQEVGRSAILVNSIPDGGITLVLLGLGLSGLAFGRRFMKAS